MYGPSLFCGSPLTPHPYIYPPLTPFSPSTNPPPLSFSPSLTHPPLSFSPSTSSPTPQTHPHTHPQCVLQWTKYFTQYNYSYLPKPFQAMEMETASNKPKKRNQEGNWVQLVSNHSCSSPLSPCTCNSLLDLEYATYSRVEPITAHDG